VIQHYSKGKNCCELCGFSNMDALSIDHISGGGRKHRKELKGQHIEHWLIRNNFPDGYRILCMNCQFRELKRRDLFNPINKIKFE